MKTMSPERFLALVECLERSHWYSLFDGGQRVRGLMHDELPECLRPEVIKKQWFYESGVVDALMVPYCDELVDVAIEGYQDRRTLLYTAPKTLRKTTVSKDQVTVFSLDEQRLLQRLAEWLDVPGFQRKQPSEAQAGGRLWWLGDCRLRKGFSYPVWLCRDVDLGLKAIDACLKQLRGKERGLILTCRSGFPVYYPLPSGFYTLPMNRAVVQSGIKVLIDKERLYTAITQPDQEEEVRLIRYDHPEKVLHIAGKNEPWVMNSADHAAVVQYLYQRALTGCWEVKAQQVIEVVRARNPRRVSLKSVDDIFSKNTVWKQYIERKRRGYYGFKLD